MSSNKTNSTVPKSVRIPFSRFVHGTVIRIEGELRETGKGKYPRNYTETLSGLYEVSTYQGSVYHVTLSPVGHADYEEPVSFSSKYDFVMATSFERVKVTRVKLNSDYTADVFSNGSVSVGCQFFSPKAAEKVALAILTAQGYTFS
jgi:hypothetical protein